MYWRVSRHHVGRLSSSRLSSALLQWAAPCGFGPTTPCCSLGLAGGFHGGVRSRPGAVLGAGAGGLDEKSQLGAKRMAGGIVKSIRLSFGGRQVAATSLAGMLFAGSQVALAAFLVVYLWKEGSLTMASGCRLRYIPSERRRRASPFWLVCGTTNFFGCLAGTVCYWDGLRADRYSSAVPRNIDLVDLLSGGIYWSDWQRLGRIAVR